MITTVVGSMPYMPPRDALMRSLYDGSDPFLLSLEAGVRAQVEAGIDIISDGQTRRGMVELFTIPLTGIRQKARPEIIAEVEWTGPITVDDVRLASDIARRVHGELKDLREGGGIVGDGSRGGGTSGAGGSGAGGGETGGGDEGGGGKGGDEAGVGAGPSRDPPPVKGIVTGPFTMTRSCRNRYYPTERDAAFAVAGALNRELKALSRVTAHLQVDEPFMSVEMPEYAEELIETVFDGVEGTRWLHVCGDVSELAHRMADMPVDYLDHEFAAHPRLLDSFREVDWGKGIGFGCVRSDDPRVEPVERIGSTLRRGADLFGAGNMAADPDCGLRHMPAAVAESKLANLSAAARRVS